jgi:hypothetical protein
MKNPERNQAAPGGTSAPGQKIGRRRWLAWLLPPALFGALPLAAERALVAWLHDGGAAGVMLGAVSGATVESIGATAVALLLRLWVVVALPGVAVAWLVLRGWPRG